MLTLKHISMSVLASFLASCGNNPNANEDTLPPSTVHVYEAEVFKDLGSLPTCDQYRSGQLYYVLSESHFLYCTPDGYLPIQFEGTQGIPGPAGSSCSLSNNPDESYSLTCSDTTIVFRNGTNGQDGTQGPQGSDGTSGTSCSVTDLGNGILTHSCTDGTSVTWPKALCGVNPYDPASLFCDARDNRLYRWVTIGSQTWMAENLAYLPSISIPADSSSVSKRFLVYDYSGTSVAEAKATVNFSTYGVLYNWPAAIEACPNGWNLPTLAEWIVLAEHVGDFAGTKLKADTLWASSSVGNIGTDEVNFAALPGGVVNQTGYNYLSTIGIWWTNTEYGSSAAQMLSLDRDATSYSLFYDDKRMGFSVRCILN